MVADSRISQTSQELAVAKSQKYRDHSSCKEASLHFDKVKPGSWKDGSVNIERKITEVKRATFIAWITGAIAAAMANHHRPPSNQGSQFVSYKETLEG